MKTRYECIPCFVRQASEALTHAVGDIEDRECIMRKILGEIAASDWSETPPAMAQRLYRTIRELAGNADPYKVIKKEMNCIAEGMIPGLRKLIAKSASPREDAVRLAIIGNLLDSGAKTMLSATDLPQHLTSMMAQPLKGCPLSLFREAAQSSSILYLADNAGEIFFDRLLIEMLPLSKITVVVRGSPTVNDATMKDAVAAGITEIVPVIGSGSDAPGTIIEDCSKEFRRLFECSDFIIAKGQGNYETLSECKKRVCFLLTVKCQVISEHIGAPLGSMVVKTLN